MSLRWTEWASVGRAHLSRLHLVEEPLSSNHWRKLCTIRHTFPLANFPAFQLCQRFPEGSATKSRAGSLCNDRGVHGGEREKATEMKAGAVGCLNAQALMLVTFKTPDGGAERRFQDEYTLCSDGRPGGT